MLRRFPASQTRAVGAVDRGSPRDSRGLDSVAVALVKDFPLFPLGIVALPSELVPLHIFEERFKTMIARCLEEECEFGIVWLADDGLRPIGCACEVAEVLERMPDGRLNLIARGTRPFRIEARQEELAYPAGTVEFLDDRGEDGDPGLAGAAHAAYADLVEQATDRVPDPEEISAMTAYEMAATVEFGLDAKQGLLDLRSEAARLKLVTRLFRAAI
jgi:Lon protease-like protein